MNNAISVIHETIISMITSVNSTNNNTTFKGIDASVPLKTLYFMAPSKCKRAFTSLMQEMRSVAQKEKFNVVCQTADEFCTDVNKLNIRENHSSMYSWLQDMVMMLPENRLFYNSFWHFDKTENSGLIWKLANLLKLKIFNPNNHFSVRKAYYAPKALAGGNIYRMKNKMGYNCVLAGKDCEKHLNLDQRYELFKTTDVDFVPQADFHIDMFLRPLANGRILVADDKMTIKWLEGIREKLLNKPGTPKEQIEKFTKFLEDFKKSVAKNDKSKKYASTEDVIKFLESKNIPKCKKYKIIRVPGRVFSLSRDKKEGLELVHNANFMNSIVQRRKDGSFAYITNKSNPANTGGIDLNEEFAQFLKQSCPAIKDVYFVGGKHYYGAADLIKSKGGIHCRVMEEPVISE